MYQSIPNAEYYKAIERSLVSAGRPSSLNFEQLAEMKIETRYQEGYVTYSGYALNKVEAQSLNKWIDEINRTRCIATRTYLEDRLHQELVICAEQLSPKDILRLDQGKQAKTAAA